MENRLQPRDLIKTANKLVPSRGRPRQSDLLRATSTAYYALFHTLAKCCADMLVGSQQSRRSAAAWRQAYRALEHGAAKNACNNGNIIPRFPDDIQDFANAFVTMQDKRHSADYDPTFKATKSGVKSDVELAGDVIKRFSHAPARDRRAFAAYVLFKNRAG